MRVALLGGGGFVGTEFSSQILGRNFELRSIGRRDRDLYDVAQLTEHLEKLSPDALVNCAGYTGKPNVDACESDKANCLAGNAVLPGVVAEACEALDIPWGHVSSGCIFTGRRPNGKGFAEIDPPNFSFRQNNCSFYSGTKALGEEILAVAKKCYIWRLRIPFSNVDGPRNYLSKLMRYPKLLDAENSLCDLTEFVAASLACLHRRLPFGTYNLTNPGSVTTREVVDLIQESGVCRKEFQFFDSDEEFMSLAAVAPRSNCVLDSSKAIQAGLKLTEVRESLENALKTWRAESPAG
ncbi:MAG: sugar nucleotide-binding protein [Candidatus Paceibacterota bacterium]